jgi:peptidoglycan hydrolase CwlO-like protein
LALHAINARMIEIAGHLRTITVDKAAIEASTAKALEQEKVLQELKMKLDGDLAKVKFERDELSSYSEALATRLATVQGQLSQLYRSNKALSRELAETTARLTEEIDRRTKAATASR